MIQDTRYFGNVAFDNKINDWLSAMVRFLDTYSELQEENQCWKCTIIHKHVTAMLPNIIMMQMLNFLLSNCN
jgi:hypothetical protein